MTPAEKLLDRLENVRQSGDRYRADCPTGHRSKGTLSITDASDGTVLLKCFANCDPLAIVQAVGLELKDLFPERPEENRKPRTPKERRKARERSRMYKVRRMLPELALECRVVLAAAGKIENAEPLTAEDHDRLAEAVMCIGSAREALH